MDPNEYTAEVYRYDEQLQATLNLGEGRQRFGADEYDLPSENADALKTLQDRVMQIEQEKKDMKRQAELREEDMRRQMEQVLDDTKCQTRS